tara:strand:- start:490 stop:630 length:141 start_codon:yes stop_codon:yes gene_type:complete
MKGLGFISRFPSICFSLLQIADLSVSRPDAASPILASTGRLDPNIG